MDKAKKIKSTIALREKSKKDKENLLLKQAKDLEVIAQEKEYPIRKLSKKNDCLMYS